MQEKNSGKGRTQGKLKLDPLLILSGEDSLFVYYAFTRARCRSSGKDLVSRKGAEKSDESLKLSVKEDPRGAETAGAAKRRKTYRLRKKERRFNYTLKKGKEDRRKTNRFCLQDAT